MICSRIAGLRWTSEVGKSTAYNEETRRIGVRRYGRADTRWAGDQQYGMVRASLEAGGTVGRLCGGDGDGEAEGGPFAAYAFDPDAPVMLFDDQFGDGQPQPV